MSSSCVIACICVSFISESVIVKLSLNNILVKIRALFYIHPENAKQILKLFSSIFYFVYSLVASSKKKKKIEDNNKMFWIYSSYLCANITKANRAQLQDVTKSLIPPAYECQSADRLEILNFLCAHIHLKFNILWCLPAKQQQQKKSFFPHNKSVRPPTRKRRQRWRRQRYMKNARIFFFDFVFY